MTTSPRERASGRSIALSLDKPPQTLVVGGGIVGLCCAHVLSERGRRVEVIEARTPGSGATGAAAGMISPLVESDFDPDFGKICRTARDLWPAWAEWLAAEGNEDLSFTARGTLLPAFSSSDLLHLDHVQQTAERQAENWERWEPEHIRQLMPELRDGAMSGLFLPNEFSVDPKAVIAALRKVLADRGVAVHSGRSVTMVRSLRSTVEIVGDGWSTECEQVVLAAGAGTGAIEGAGALPVRAVQGEMIAFEGEFLSDGPTVRTADHYALGRRGEVLVGATVKEVDSEPETTVEGRKELRQVALDLFPKLQWKKIARHWAGLRPATQDRLPILGMHESEHIIVATGHYRNGVLLAPWTARVVADLLAHKRSMELPEAFSPQRFSNDS